MTRRSLRISDSIQTRVVALIFALAFTIASDASADDGAKRLRSIRHLGVGNITFLNDIEPSLQAGYLFQISLMKSGVEKDQFGADEVVAPRWYAHSLVSAGWSFDEFDSKSGGFSGRGQLGLLYEFDTDFTVNRLGPVGQATWGPEGYGAGLRTEFFHGNAALSVGWMALRDGKSDGVFVTIDLLRCILQDLGIVKSCVIE